MGVVLGVALPAAAAAVALVAGGPARGPGPAQVALSGVSGMASVSVDVPAGYGVAVAAPGERLGPTLTAVQPTAETDALAQECGLAPAQTWQLTVGATTVPLFVDPAAGFAARLVLCRPPDLPPFAFSSSAITQPTAPGSFRWTSLWTRAGAAPLEAQSLVRAPAVATLRLTRHRVSAPGSVATLVRFSTSLAVRGTPPASARVETRADGVLVGGATGSFLLARGRTAVVRVSALVDGDSGTVAGLAFHDLGACAPLLGADCVDATLGSTVVTAEARLRGYK